MADLYSRHAISLDADYDGGASDHQSDDDSDDLGCFAPIAKLTRKAPASFAAGSRRPDRKKQKTQEKEKQNATEEKPKQMEDSSSDSSVAAPKPLTTSNSPSQRKINALQQQMKQVVEGYTHTAAVDADVSDAEETQESEAGTSAPVHGVHDAARTKSAEKKRESIPKCVIEVKSCEIEQGKKFRIFMTDPMSKIFLAFCSKNKIKPETVKFVFDGLSIAESATPLSLGMEEDEDNMVEVVEMQNRR
mmetsp:Transcript_27292/g.55766  ORF Transcript_27292/g.55766 Transcript_27292/m.55766 type:complete len:247 (-) Transcript_27292:276-1016(-)|eukprot:CAMPEP_0181323204 /NCGR_PEP_ID=MMETSP1101-20121128/19650_1 /TAXON_ID=46948 /ORGANISM="Rhodomonas abbreviata, Strain Caron Lab Isolate" /LENGTH=246 /DNA_ID=CAMNT_0023431195 /DNA_START=68 /DNA_END=808 /DNA_ORIENTATION=+